MTRKWWRWAPFAIALLFLVAFSWRLINPPDPTIRSRMVGRPVPEFVLPAAMPGKPALASAELAGGGPRLVNVFASWCVPCIAEAQMLGQLQRRGVHLDGIAIRDRPSDVAEFLARNGDPFERIGADYDSRVQLAMGSSGVPESFVVDGRGIVRYQHIGPIMPADVPLILGELDKAR